MNLLKKSLVYTIGITAVFYLAVCAYFYFRQDDIIFVPTRLAENYKFTFSGNYAERKIKTADGTILSGLLFRSDSSKEPEHNKKAHSGGLIFYLHGNGGALNTWGDIADIYTSLGYDVFMLDYRGYGKSGGKITSEGQFYDDIQTAYNDLRSEYPENRIIVLGYSIGTAPAAMIAARNKPGMLILQAPYYSMTDILKRNYPFLPAFMLKYPLRTNDFLRKTTAPVVIFHGDADQVIYYGSSLKLKECLKPGDRLITLKGQGHSGISRNPEYLSALKKILEQE